MYSWKDLGGRRDSPHTSIMRTAAILFVVALGALGGACSGSGPAAASSTANVIVVGAPAAPAGLPGFQIDSGAPSVSDVPLTCSALVCFETLQLQNNGAGCAGNIDGNINVFSAPASLVSLLTTSNSSIRIPNNPVVTPGQIVSVNVAIPVPAENYVVTAVLNWINTSCPS
jgi:hypothetical protein